MEVSLSEVLDGHIGSVFTLDILGSKDWEVVTEGSQEVGGRLVELLPSPRSGSGFYGELKLHCVRNGVSVRILSPGVGPLAGTQPVPINSFLCVESTLVVEGELNTRDAVVKCLAADLEWRQSRLDILAGLLKSSKATKGN